MQIDQQSITFMLGIAALLSIVFNVYNTFRNPQIKSDNDVTVLRGEIETLKKTVTEIKETHLRTVENDIKNLTAAVNDLGKTVIKLSTIIDERIPKGSPSLTPPGV